MRIITIRIRLTRPSVRNEVCGHNAGDSVSAKVRSVAEGRSTLRRFAGRLLYEEGWSQIVESLCQFVIGLGRLSWNRTDAAFFGTGSSLGPDKSSATVNLFVKSCDLQVSSPLRPPKSSNAPSPISSSKKSSILWPTSCGTRTALSACSGLDVGPFGFRMLGIRFLKFCAVSNK